MNFCDWIQERWWILKRLTVDWPSEPLKCVWRTCGQAREFVFRRQICPSSAQHTYKSRDASVRTACCRWTALPARTSHVLVFIPSHEVYQGRSVIYDMTDSEPAPSYFLLLLWARCTPRAVTKARLCESREAWGERKEKTKRKHAVFAIDGLPFGQKRDSKSKRPCREMNLLNATVISRGRAKALLFESHQWLISVKKK